MFDSGEDELLVFLHLNVWTANSHLQPKFCWTKPENHHVLAEGDL